MGKKLTIPGIIVAIICFVGCSELTFGDQFLEKAPGVDVTIDTIFSSKLYADRALVSVYSTLKCGLTIWNRDYPGGSSYDNEGANNLMGNDVLDALVDIIQTYCTWGGVFQSYYVGNYNAESENTKRSTKQSFLPTNDNAWKGIRKGFLYIENVDKVPDMTQEEKTRGKGECYLIIATHYLEMLRHFGGIPIVKNSIAADNVEKSDFTRKTVQEVADYIIELCDTAASMLPWTVSAEEDGKMTKAAALAVKCRLLSFMASPFMNSSQPYTSEKPTVTVANKDKVDPELIEKMYWLGNYDASRWQDVVDACEAFFRENEAEGNPYRLIQTTGTTIEDYRSAWNRTYADRNNGEILIASGRHQAAFVDLYHTCYYGPTNGGRGYGGGCITLNFVDLFTDFTTGQKSSYAQWIKDNNNSGFVGPDIEGKTPFLNKDPRLYESVMIVGDHFMGRCVQTWVGGLERGEKNEPRCPTGFHSRKFLWDYDSDYSYRPANYSYLRLADVILIYAEALNEVGRRADAIAQLNRIRTRVGLPELTDRLLENLQGEGKVLPTYSDPLLGDPKLREEILDERSRELFFEESRWYDVVRWKREDVLRKTLYGIDMTITGGNYDAGRLDLNFSEPWETPARYWKNNWDPKWYLSAFPSNEINKGYGLVQNPGW